MEELQVIETTSGRQFKPWASKEDVQAIGQAVEQAVQDPESVTGLVSEIASGKQAIASAINAKGGTASAMESFTELAEAIQDTPTSGVLSSGIVQSEPFSFLDYVCRQGGHPFTEIDDDSVTEINRPSAFYNQTQLLKVRMSALGVISGGQVFSNCSALQNVTMPNLTTISGSAVFANCLSLQEIEIPNLVTISGDGVFAYCLSLQEIEIPNLVTISGDGVFQNSDNLKIVKLPKCSVISGLYIFYFGRGLVNVVFGTLTRIENPFYGAVGNLRNITIGQDTNINLPFQGWAATNVIGEGQSGIDELNSNLQTNLISKLYQGGGKILRLGAALYDVTTQETRDMVTAKGWTLQRG